MEGNYFFYLVWGGNDVGLCYEGGQEKNLMFVHISHELDAHGETINTLKFAERVATVELGAARSNKESGEVRELKEQVCVRMILEKYVSFLMIILFVLHGSKGLKARDILVYFLENL